MKEDDKIDLYANVNHDDYRQTLERPTIDRLERAFRTVTDSPVESPVDLPTRKKGSGIQSFLKGLFFKTHSEIDENDPSESDFDYIVLRLTPKANYISVRSNKIYNDHLIRRDLEYTSIINDGVLTLDSGRFILDSVYWVNTNTNNSCHAIAGITCDGERYVYNGWTKR